MSMLAAREFEALNNMLAGCEELDVRIPHSPREAARARGVGRGRGCAPSVADRPSHAVARMRYLLGQLCVTETRHGHVTSGAKQTLSIDPGVRWM